MSIEAGKGNMILVLSDTDIKFIVVIILKVSCLKNNLINSINW